MLYAICPMSYAICPMPAMPMMILGMEEFDWMMVDMTALL